MKRSLVALAAVVILMAACNSDNGGGNSGGTGGAAASGASGPSTGAGLKIAFVYTGATDNGGWDTGHYTGAQQVAEAFPDAEITHVENINYGDQARNTFTDLASQGYDLIVGTSFYQDDMLPVAADFPDTKFLCNQCYQLAENVGDYEGRSEEGRYLDGIVAGSMTQSNIIGYPAGFPIPEVVRGINAFTLGAQTVNPDVKVLPVYINSWYDPPKERQAAESLVNNGADILVFELNSTAVSSVAERSGVYFMGYGWDQSDRVAPETWLGTFTFNWGPYYVQQVKDLIDGTWKSEAYRGGIAEGMIETAPLGQDVPDDVASLVEKTKADIASGSLDIFAGPITNNDGSVQIPEGETLPQEERSGCCDWYVQGVEGSVPSS
jgi:basic membrane protein A and related proteins